MNLTDVAIDIATVSFLLFLGFALRVKIVFFSEVFHPGVFDRRDSGIAAGTPGVG